MQRLIERAAPRIDRDHPIDPAAFLADKPNVVTDLHALLDALEAAFADRRMTIEIEPVGISDMGRTHRCIVRVVDPSDERAVVNVWGEWLNRYCDEHPRREKKRYAKGIAIMAFSTRAEWLAA